MVPSVFTHAAMLAALPSIAFVVVHAHQRVYLPAPTYTITDRGTQWSPLAYLESQGFTNTSADFNGWLAENNYATLREFMDSDTYKVVDGADQQCGWTDINAERQEIPTGGVYRTSGYTHDGPCEVWLGDTMVYQGENCNVDAPGKDHELDYTACGDSCTFYWYWLGIRYLDNKYSWQVYKECIPLGVEPSSLDGSVATGSVGADYEEASDSHASEEEVNADSSSGSSVVGGEADSADSTAPTTTEAPATEVPATETPTTEAPATETPETEAPETEAPATETPIATTTAPVNCKVKGSRRA